MTCDPAIVRFTHDPPQDPVRHLGGKGLILNRMTHAGYQVPAGFTLTVGLCRTLQRLPNEYPDSLKQQIHAEIQQLERSTGSAFGVAQSPLVLAVRSGAAQSMPGTMQTILGVGVTAHMLNVTPRSPVCDRAWVLLQTSFREATARHGEDADAIPRPDTQRWRLPEDPWQQLWLAIHLVARSWDSTAARTFRDRLNLGELPGTAISVQLFCDIQVAGVLYTRHPHPDHADSMLAEWSFENAEVVSGSRTPRATKLPRHDGPLEHQLGCNGVSLRTGAAVGCTGEAEAGLPANTQRLSAPGGERWPEVTEDCPLPPRVWRELVGLGQRLETESWWCDRLDDDEPTQGLDIEWGWHEQTGVVLFQARRAGGHSHSPDRAAQILQQTGGHRSVFVRHSLAESLEHPTPLTWCLMRRMMSGRGAMGEVYRQLGFRPRPTTRGDCMVVRIGGQIYADAVISAGLFDCGIPCQYDLDQLANDPDLFEQAPTVFDPDACGPWFLLQLPWSLFRTARAAWRAAPAVTAIRRRQQTVLAAHRAWLCEQQAVELADLCSDALCNLFVARVRHVIDRFAIQTLLWGIYGGAAVSRFRHCLTSALGDAGKSADLAGELLTKLGRWPVTPALAAQWMMQGTWSRREFLARFGHRGPHEWELSAITYRDRIELSEFPPVDKRPGASSPSVTPEMCEIDDVLPEILWIRSDWQLSDAQDALAAALSTSPRSRQIHKLTALAQRAARLAPDREMGRDAWLRGYDLIRQVVLELARRGELDQHSPADVFFLNEQEVANIPSNLEPLREACGRRRQQWKMEWLDDLPRVIDTRQEATVQHLEDTESTSMWIGTPLAPGRAVGQLCQLDAAMRQGVPRHVDDRILICRSLDVGHMPWLLAAKGIITEQGGMLSHAAIVARQCQIPLVRLENAVQLLSGVARVELNGGAGRITRVD